MISPQTLFLLYPTISAWLDLWFIAEVKDKFSHKLGKRVTIPKIKIIPPEIYFQKSCGISMKRVLNFRSRVKRKTEIPKDSITVIILLLLGVESAIDLPTITGKRGKIHGAKIVNTPAMKEIIKRVIIGSIFQTLELRELDYQTIS